MVGAGEDIYLVDQIFSSFEMAAPSWLKKSPVQVIKADIQRIDCVGPDSTVRYRFERAGKGKDLALVSPPTNGTVKPSALNRLAGALTGLKIEDVADPSSPPESLADGVSPRLDYTLFNGITYHVYPGLTCSPGIPCYMRIQVASKDKKNDGDTGEGALIAKAKKMNALPAPWFFMVPERQHQAFFLTLGEMLENKTKK